MVSKISDVKKVGGVGGGGEIGLSNPPNSILLHVVLKNIRFYLETRLGRSSNVWSSSERKKSVNTTFDVKIDASSNIQCKKNNEKRNILYFSFYVSW